MNYELHPDYLKEREAIRQELSKQPPISVEESIKQYHELRSKTRQSGPPKRKRSQTSEPILTPEEREELLKVCREIERERGLADTPKLTAESASE